MTLEFPPKWHAWKTLETSNKFNQLGFLRMIFWQNHQPCRTWLSTFHPVPSYESSKPLTLEIHSDPSISQKNPQTFPEVDWLFPNTCSGLLTLWGATFCAKKQYVTKKFHFCSHQYCLTTIVASKTHPNSPSKHRGTLLDTVAIIYNHQKGSG